jgi:hypothetical protein
MDRIKEFLRLVKNNYFSLSAENIKAYRQVNSEEGETKYLLCFDRDPANPTELSHSTLKFENSSGNILLERRVYNENLPMIDLLPFFERTETNQFPAYPTHAELVLVGLILKLRGKYPAFDSTDEDLQQIIISIYNSSVEPVTTSDGTGGTGGRNIPHIATLLDEEECLDYRSIVSQAYHEIVGLSSKLR